MPAAVNRELRDFLRAARARVAPAEVGIDVPVVRSGRRVPGLRREEVARIAGVSVDYYVRLEQGRTRRVSREVLDAVADALRLNDTEREHLHTLVEVQVERRPRGRARTARRVRPGALRLLDAVGATPAFITGPGMALLAANRTARALLFDPDERPEWGHNLAMWIFLDPEARERYVDWSRIAAETAAILRRDAVSAPGDRDLHALLGELTVRSADFRATWEEQLVYECTHGRKRLQHPVVGRLEVDYEALDVPGSPGQKLFVYTTEEGSPSRDRMAELARWTRPDAGLDALPGITAPASSPAPD